VTSAVLQQIPAANPFSLVAFFALPSLDPAAVHPDSAPATALLARYMNLQCESEQGAAEAGEGARGYSDLRNKVFKVVPSVRNGPYFVKRATGSKPALLGRKLTQVIDYYYLALVVGVVVVRAVLLLCCCDSVILLSRCMYVLRC
jgi:Protein ENHANCED DISEASE RESISTANCE 2, C-terminal